MATSNSANRTVLRLRCEADDCEEIGETARAEHPPDAPQINAVENALRQIADEHAAETGHETTVETEGVDAN
jgi:hypothetical protein